MRDESIDASRVWVTFSDEIVVTGSTASRDLPVTANAPQSRYQGGPNDAFVGLLDGNSGSIRFMTYFGGNDEDFPRAIAMREL